MPYCKNCGAELHEDAKFSPSCGTYVGPPMAERRENKEATSTLTIFLIVLDVSAAIVVTLVSLPVRTVDVTHTRYRRCSGRCDNNYERS